ncbi:MAG: hypothetical protein LBQ66_07535, partial [Planctomycetaceae bacterium]|nr:hypothetical protein [Planctomycetaceae bacterium]
MVGKCFPTRLGVSSKLVRFPNAQRRAGRPRSSPSPLRGNCRLRRWVTRFGISTRFPPLRDEGKPRPYNVNVFLVLPMRFPIHCR